jgi:hypothetical protein
MSSRNKNVDDFDVESLDVDSMIMIDPEPHHTLSIPNNSNTTTMDVNLSDDPFAPREGKTLLWRGVNMTLVSLLEIRSWSLHASISAPVLASIC